MKHAFTMIELIFVIVVMGILALISSELMLNIYKNYIYARSINELEYKTDIILDQISKRLQNRISSSTIAREMSENGKESTKNIFSLSSSAKETINYALEWISTSYETQILKNGWSGVADLTSFTQDKKDKMKYTFTSPGSSFDENFIKTLTDTYGKNGDKNFGIIFNKNGTDIEKDFGYINKDHDLIAVENLKDKNKLEIIIPKTDFEARDKFYLVNTAYAVVLEKIDENLQRYKNLVLLDEKNTNKNHNVYDLYLYYNYRPWLKENFIENGEKSLLAQNVTMFRFTQAPTGIVVMKLCMQTANTKESNLVICKTKAVY